MVRTSMPTVGSSMIRILAEAASHLARLTFCWLPPLRLPTGGRQRRRLDVQLGRRSGSTAAFSARRLTQPEGVLEALPDGDRDVRHDRVEEDQPLLLPVLGDVADPVLVEGVPGAVGSWPACRPRGPRRR